MGGHVGCLSLKAADTTQLEGQTHSTQAYQNEQQADSRCSTLSTRVYSYTCTATRAQLHACHAAENNRGC